MAEFVNTTAFIVLAVPVYLFVVIFTVVNVSKKAGELYGSLPGWMRANKQVNDVLDFISIYIIANFKKIFGFLFRLLAVICSYFGKFDDAFIRISVSTFNEVLNYSSLGLRKLYTENFQLIIVYCSLVIVLFYFILSIF